MSWDYRVIRHKEPFYEGGEFLEIHEVYYDKHGNPEDITEDGVSVGGESIESLTQTLEDMRRALVMPILDYEIFPKRENSKRKVKGIHIKRGAR